MSLTYTSGDRDLNIRATVRYAGSSSTSRSYNTQSIVSYSANVSIGSDGLPLGGTEASTYSLTIDNVSKDYTTSEFDNAYVSVDIGLVENGVTTWSPFGRWYVDAVDMPEQSTTLTLHGYDALASKFDKKITDLSTAYPTTIGSLVALACAAAGVQWDSNNHNFPNAAIGVTKKPKWDENMTIRDLLSYCAICAGGYAHITRKGTLEIKSFIGSEQYDIDPDVYRTFTLTGGQAFNLNCLEVLKSDSNDNYTRYAYLSSIEDNPTNTIQIDYSPMWATGVLSADVFNSLISNMHGITMVSGEVDWVGDPAIECGDYINITAMDEETYKIMVLSEDLNFDGGLSVVHRCNLPSSTDISNSGYSSGVSAFDRNGNIRVTRISGLDESVISATNGYIGNLTSDTILTDSLMANIIKALNLTADVGTIEHLSGSTLSYGSVNAEKIEGHTITGDQIQANSIGVGELNVGEVVAEVVQSEELQANYAHVTDAVIDSAKIDVADIVVENVDTQFVRQGNADDYYIDKLRVTSAQILNLMVGLLVFQASNGDYYKMDVQEDTDGTLRYVPVQYDSDDIIEVTEPDGTVSKFTADHQSYVFEEVIDANELTASNARIADALITRLNASKLTASEAFIKKLSVLSIEGSDGSPISTLRDTAINAAIAGQIGQYITASVEDGVVVRAKYLDDDGEVQTSRFRTQTNNTGLHVYDSESSGFDGTGKVASFNSEGTVTKGVEIGKMRVRATQKGWAWVKGVNS